MSYLDDEWKLKTGQAQENARPPGKTISEVWDNFSEDDQRLVDLTSEYDEQNNDSMEEGETRDEEKEMDDMLFGIISKKFFSEIQLF